MNNPNYPGVAAAAPTYGAQGVPTAPPMQPAYQQGYQAQPTVVVMDRHQHHHFDDHHHGHHYDDHHHGGHHSGTNWLAALCACMFCCFLCNHH